MFAPQIFWILHSGEKFAEFLDIEFPDISLEFAEVPMQGIQNGTGLGYR